MTAEETPSRGDIFHDRESMMKVWIDERRNIDVNASLMWENLRFFSVLITAIITANTFFLNLTVNNPSLGNGVFSLVLPSLVILLSIFGYRDMGRRWERTLEPIAHLNKLEELLGLHSPSYEEKCL